MLILGSSMVGQIRACVSKLAEIAFRKMVLHSYCINNIVSSLDIYPCTTFVVQQKSQTKRGVHNADLD